MTRVYLRVYLAVLASIVLFILLSLLAFKLFDFERRDNDASSIVAELAAEILPPDLDAAKIDATLQRWHQRFNANLTLYDGNGQLLSQAGRQVAAPDPHTMREAVEGDIWHRGRMVVALPGDRFLAANDASGRGIRRWKGPASILGLLTIVGLAVAIVTLPMARRLTRRLEALQDSVQAFGDGDLSRRSPVTGKDEVAVLATRFNESADRIEKLVNSQKSLLANASHELRSPLARIRMAAELFAQGKSDGVAQDELLRNVDELDELVGEILLASRLDSEGANLAAGPDRSRWSDLDLGGLLAEESARCGLSPDAISLPIQGDARMLRRLIRNLLENAQRYALEGQGADSISMRLEKGASTSEPIVLTVCDRGPGIPADEAERIFEPFYRARGASERAGGVGLGLSLVRQIARHHGGTVHCEAREGGGTCFVVALPADLSQAATESGSP